MSYSGRLFLNKQIVISDDENNGGQEPVGTAVLPGDRALLLDLQRRMLEIRFFEDEVMRLFMLNLVRGSTHLYQGQEAVAVGACSALRKGDTMTCTYRGHGAVLAMGAPLDRTMAEILGKAEGLCSGKGGSMHLTDFSVGALGSFAIVGAHLPFATGAALSAQQLETGAVSIAFFGDGTTNIGAFHEALNLAAVWKLPVIFVCENNGYAISVPIRLQMKNPDIADRARGYGIVGVTVDGTDVPATFAVCKEAVERARRGQGPTLIDAKIWRMNSHTSEDNQLKYRTKQEIADAAEHDPIERFRSWLLKRGWIAADEAARIQAECDREASDAADWAEQQPDPVPEDALKHLFA